MIQIYTGNNKGKTTAAIGQGIRACGNGFNVIMIQFLKTSSSGELNILKNSFNDSMGEILNLKCQLNEMLNLISNLEYSKNNI